jgi:hypothetical protein
MKNLILFIGVTLICVSCANDNGKYAPVGPYTLMNTSTGEIFFFNTSGTWERLAPELIEADAVDEF